MPYGFSGKAADGFLLDVTDALRAAAVRHSEDPLAGVGGGPVPTPGFPTPVNRENPFAGGGGGGGHATGVGSQTNVVLDNATYSEITRRIALTDTSASKGLKSAIEELEALCESSYTMPKAQPQFQAATRLLASSLGESGTLAEEAARLARRLAEDLSAVT
ncbi:MAG: hypothetical protein LBR44_00810 [Clostridiales Family XIII bacterium]|jgi:hypothetical protein|nr:hypothetical protein [Clostridiales Family XIII bacterium]